MRIFLACVLLAAHAVPALAADACSLLTQSQAALVTGEAVVQTTPGGPVRDEDSGGQVTYCTYRAAKSALVVSVVEFRSNADAQKQLTQQLVQERMEAQDAKVTEESGLGEKSFYGASAKGASFVFLHKNKVIGVGIGGAQAGQGADAKELLRTAAKAVASRS